MEQYVLDNISYPISYPRKLALFLLIAFCRNLAHNSYPTFTENPYD